MPHKFWGRALYQCVPSDINTEMSRPYCPLSLSLYTDLCILVRHHTICMEVILGNRRQLCCHEPAEMRFLVIDLSGDNKA
jgi:hypothetical protein